MGDGLIEGHAPAQWQDLQERAAQVLCECGMDAETDRRTTTARGDVDVDVFATDPGATPPSTILVECKHWQRPVPQTIIHGFRTVVADVGANLGIIVSSAGFQSGAGVASQFTNLQLVDWCGFEAMFEKRWYAEYMARTLHEIVDPLLEYTEPINTRIFRKADALSEPDQKRFGELRDKYMILGIGFIPVLIPFFGESAPAIPSLPLRAVLTHSYSDRFGALPDDVLDAAALRPLMDSLVQHFESAIAELDELFGERA